MKRSLIFLAVAALAVSACGTTGRFAGTQRYQDGIYSATAAPAVTLLTEDEFAATLVIVGL